MVPPGLRSAGYVFIRHDAHRGPLQPPYDGPFRVLEHGPKHLVVDIGGRPEHVSVDRVKLAHLDVTQPVDLAIPPRRGRPPGQPAPPAEVPSTSAAPSPPITPPVTVAPRPAQLEEVGTTPASPCPASYGQESFWTARPPLSPC
ncbi:hypothetical protein AAFF_G00366660 [Aldrovandia affinis]|uniref:Uncharacterized protein n=1 Tax=Aldrovandia affinis TaxID=143900 RepID=A0AAD7WMW2_9TELE|nr:hypothetical protein AAFF_G00366660 [Aldrovandia affinis]